MDLNDEQMMNKKEYEHDEMNLSVSTENTGAYHVMLTTVVSSENEDDDKTISIGDESDYEERHRGICDNCHYTGILGTECIYWDQPKWAQIVSIDKGWQVFLDQVNHEASLSNEEWMRAIET
jgi:hypothetical protein